ncbi:hypothetical protein [Streptomyces sp. NPDC006134]|uniref:hypothetical protein n=1 Tax=Streptomyces sp. NPDC006134 TaxID=3154467 RepID=UPI0033DB98CA
MSEWGTGEDGGEVRALLGRAVETVPVPAGRGSEAVFARAARLRRRRRAAVTGAAAAAVAAAVVLGSGVLPGPSGGNVAASPAGGGTGTGAAGFAGLLPPGTGEVREVSLPRLIKQVPDAEPPEDVGPYDGEYAVERNGGTGYLVVRVRAPGAPWKTDPAEDPCTVDGGADRRDCTTERLPDGSRLSVWESVQDPDDGGRPQWGPELAARLLLKDGTVLDIRDSTGFRGTGEQGPLLKTFPLTRAQLRELALRPELLP